MIERTNVKSATTPVEVFYTDKNVYVRSNIKKITKIDPVFTNETTLYIYDEIEYTLDEWNDLNIKKLENKITALEKAMRDLSEIVESLR